MATTYNPLTGMPDAFTRTVNSRNAQIAKRLEEDLAAGGRLSPLSPEAEQIYYPNSPTSAGGGGGYANLLTIAGSQPDFLGILNSDPLLQQFRTNTGAESVADRSQLALARQRALAGFGLVPDLTNSLGLVGSDINEDITSEVRGLAQQNTAEGLSTVGRLNREFERVQQNLMDALAARGALRSGATGVALADLQQDRKQAVSDATSQLVDYLAGTQRGFVDAQRQRAREIAQAQAEAAGRIDPSRLAPTEPEEAELIGYGPNGEPIYRGRKTKRLFGPNGEPWNGPEPTSQAPQQQAPPPQEQTVTNTQSAFDPVGSRPAELVTTRFRGF